MNLLVCARCANHGACQAHSSFKQILCPHLTHPHSPAEGTTLIGHVLCHMTPLSLATSVQWSMKGWLKRLGVWANQLLVLEKLN